MADSPLESGSLGASWFGFGRSLAVATGALLALLSLYFHVPVWVAAVRGGLAFLGVWAIVRATQWLLIALQADARRAPSKKRVES
jgi:hypothetical protein